MRRTVFALVVVSLAQVLPAAAGSLSSPTNLVGGAAPGGAASMASPACAKPGMPACMNDAATFTNADRMTQCQGEVRDYVDRSMAYLQCLSNEHQNAGQELSRNVDRFNCRLSGSRTCG
ncbi:hypothetical protein M2352_001697 [Azospirillum fermentarium]|uniref:hypothetical protein n=1 Tax=Azospirillum fermentarium TaxID=1233114 RepID=UPI002226F0AE|nr:hypothetical protein [Azospirillum fermentarium]MCW2246106.1 hypothetical protein [Azospirillum fermentarium]